MYTIVNVSMKELSKIIREFEKLSHKSSEKRRPKHGPTNIYFYLSRHIAKCTMRSDSLYSYYYPVIMEMTGAKHIPILHVCSTDNIKSKEFVVDETLLQVCSTDKEE